MQMENAGSDRPDVLTIPEVARRLRISRNHTYLLAQQGRLPVLRLGRKLLVPLAQLEKMLAGEAQPV